MALKGPGVFHRTREHEEEDASNITKNILAESWKSWPNEAAFDRLEEHRGPLRLTVKGSIPSWAAGTLYRTGPGQSRVEDTSRGTHFTTHWFDGFAQTHRFDIIPTDEGETQVWYSSRRQGDEWIEDVKKKGWRSGMTFGQKADPCVGLFAKAMTIFEPKLGNHNVALMADVPGVLSDEKDESTNHIDGPLGHRVNTRNLFVATDYTGMRRIDPSTLEPLGETTQSHLHPSLSGPCSCAHAQRDPISGDLFNYNLAFGRVPTYRIFRVDAASGETEILATISDLNVPSAYMHSFFLTDNHVVICIPASQFAWRGLKTQWEGNIIDSMKPFDQKRKCKWLVVDRKHGKGLVATFSTPAAFFFHSINAFEEIVKDEKGSERTDLFFDLVKYDTMDIIKGFYYDVIMDRDDATKKYWFENERYKNCAPTLTRYRFTLPSTPTPDTTFSANGEQVLAIPSPHAGELPSIHPLRVGKPYRYVYSAALRGLTTVVDALVKTDLTTGDALIWTGPEGHTPGEPVFVPRPGSREEDDGIIFSLIVNGVAETAYILCLDGKTMEEMGRAEAEFAIGQGFHGLHLPAA
ncbi:beta-carotene 15,15'-dioxygenase [Fusarium heterosporum]|uniref:Beta-carotene 15,15'-dioxygenase n=1 Tax=Fusarium heterosporum TaxID=42747 RepID=A0A8H5U0U8_FUSHE|nr:beta-carotene 15,15'-dioxygenase [Fusarium heterosporum]